MGGSLSIGANVPSGLLLKHLPHINRDSPYSFLNRLSRLLIDSERLTLPTDLVPVDFVSMNGISLNDSGIYSAIFFESRAIKGDDSLAW